MNIQLTALKMMWTTELQGCGPNFNVISLQNFFRIGFCGSLMGYFIIHLRIPKKGQKWHCWFHKPQRNTCACQYPPSLLSIAPLIVTNWWFQPLWKIWKSDWIIIPNLVGEVIKFMFQSPSTRLIVSYYPPVNYYRCGVSTIFRSYCSREKKNMGFSTSKILCLPQAIPWLRSCILMRQVLMAWMPKNCLLDRSG